MTDQPTGEQQPWEAHGAFSPTPPKPERQPRQRRTRKEPALAAPFGKAAEEAAPKKTRKPRAAKKEKAERAAPETIKVTMREYAEMRVGDDAKVFIKLHGILSTLTKGARSKVLAELSKVLS